MNPALVSSWLGEGDCDAEVDTVTDDCDAGSDVIAKVAQVFPYAKIVECCLEKSERDIRETFFSKTAELTSDPEESGLGFRNGLTGRCRTALILLVQK